MIRLISLPFFIGGPLIKTLKVVGMVMALVTAAFAAETVVIELLDIPKIRKSLGLSPEYDKLPNIAKVKIAVLDNGFEGFQEGIGYLPNSARLISNEHYIAFLEKMGEDYAREHGLYVKPVEERQEGESIYHNGPPPSGSTHGLRMAQLAWAAAGNMSAGPEFYLLNAYTRVNFKRAVRYAMDELKVDIILYSQNYESSGNFDGRGSTNLLVNQATAAGIIWVNSAGNYAERVYNGPVMVGADGYVRFGQPDSQLESLKLRTRDGVGKVSVVLSWNAFTDDQESGTDKDLDLEIKNSKGEIINDSDGRLTQVPYKETALGENETFMGQEKVNATLYTHLKRGDYELRVIAKGGTFDPHRDRLRITLVSETEPSLDPVTGKLRDLVVFLNNPTIGREIMVPADNPNVITVADFGSWASQGPTMDGRQKPEIYLPIIKTRFLNNDSPLGTSGAAAYFAGIVCSMKSVEPRLTRVDILRLNHLSSEAMKTNENIAGRSQRRILDGLHHASLKKFNSVSQNVAFNKMWEVEVEAISDEVKRHFPRFNWKEMKDLSEVEFYLVPEVDQQNGRTVVAGYSRRSTVKANGERAPYPWEVFGKDPSEYVKFRLTKQRPWDVKETPDIWNREWRTPTQAVLKQLYG